MYIPKDHEFTLVPGLALRGIFQPLVWVGHFMMGDGLTWMMGRLRTLDTYTSQPVEISFKTPYPSDIEQRWRLADFVSWMMSHEMMEAVTFNGEPLYHIARLATDHDVTISDDRVYMMRLSKIRERYHRDRGERRWDAALLGDALGLSLNPAWR